MSTKTAATRKPAARQDVPQKDNDPLKNETYWWVQWGPKVRVHDSERIWLGWCGERKHWARGVPTVVPRRFLNVADDAREPRFTMVPGEGMKQLSPLWTKPYEILRNMGKNGQATEEDYNRLLTQGTKTYKEVVTVGRPIS